MRIAIVNTTDLPGGAARCSYDLARSLHNQGHSVNLSVGWRVGSDPFVTQLHYARWDLAWRNLWFEKLGLTDTTLVAPVLHCLFRPELRNVEVCNIHNMHGAYWNIWTLPILVRRAPLVLTLHDEWLLTGDCTYSYDCQRWLNGCGSCPQADWPVLADRYAIGGRDNTRFNLHLKRLCTRLLPAARVAIVCPSRWLLAHARRTSHLGRFRLRHIEYGVDLDTYRPLEAPRARAELGLPQDRFLILASAGDLGYSRKNLPILAELLHSSRWPTGCLLVCVGEVDHRLRKAMDGGPAVFLGSLKGRNQMAKAIAACDVGLITAVAENSPYIILETLACGRPVIAPSVGGIPELIEDRETGWLLPEEITCWDLAEAIERLLETSPEERCQMRRRCRAQAEARFSLVRFVDDYLSLFREMAGGGASPPELT